MEHTDDLRDSIIGKVLAIADKDYLLVLNQLIGKSQFINDAVKLNKAQKLALQLSDDDIAQNRLVSQEDLDGSVNL